MNKKIWLKTGLTTLIMLLISFFLNIPSFIQLPTPTFFVTEHVHKELPQKEMLDSQLTKAQEKEEFTEEKLIQLTTEFINKLVQEIDDNYRVLSFNTKDELLDDFEKIMSRDIAKSYVDYYYEEENGELYIVPTETPPWFDAEREYDMIQLNDYQLKVVQKNDSVFYGHFVIELEFTFTDSWRITDVVIK